MATATETLNRVRVLSKDMAAWVDGQRTAGWSDHVICTMLKEAAGEAQAMKLAPSPTPKGRIDE